MRVLLVICLLIGALPATADENLFGYVRGSETLPEASKEFYEVLTSRNDKGAGYYSALDSETEAEYGVTNSLTILGSVKMQGIQTRGLVIDGYLPKDESYRIKPSGVETALKYNILSPAKDDFGVSLFYALDYAWLDPHSGQKKETLSFETQLLLQKYFLEGELVWVGNLGLESTRAKRAEIADLPPDFDWPTVPEMEVEVKAGSGLSFRVAPRWYLGTEALYETEHETEVGEERWSIFAGPSIHYGSESWWSTLTWIQQLRGGGEVHSAQTDDGLHLVEKTKYEVRFKVGLNF